MSNRFWVGGTGTWDGSSTTHWSASSGGSGGASVPVAGDSVSFDSSSGSGTVTITASFSGGGISLNAAGFTGTLSGGVSVTSCTLGASGSYSGLDVTWAAGSTSDAFLTNYQQINSLTLNNGNYSGGASLTVNNDLILSGALVFTGGAYKADLLFGSSSNVIGSLSSAAPSSGTYGLKSSRAGFPSGLSDSSGTNTLTAITAQDIGFSGGAAWVAGAGFVDGGGNSGLSGGASSATNSLFGDFA